MFNRKNLNERYYEKWKPSINVFEIEKDKIDNKLLVNFYQEYIEKLKSFINELDIIQPQIDKISFKKNNRQYGGYKRCVLTFQDNGWKEKYLQYTQAYKELMVDYLYYSDDLEYEDISLDEIYELKKMAYFLICQAERNIYELIQ